MVLELPCPSGPVVGWQVSRQPLRGALRALSLPLRRPPPPMKNTLSTLIPPKPPNSCAGAFGGDHKTVERPFFSVLKPPTPNPRPPAGAMTTPPPRL